MQPAGTLIWRETLKNKKNDKHTVGPGILEKNEKPGK
jgi:hypothetical protein